MSTALDLRQPSDPASIGRAAPVAPSRPPTSQPPGRARARDPQPTRRAMGGRARVVAGGRGRPFARPGNAGLAALIILILSVLGMVYLTQISHVARYGYLLSDLQSRQARLDRENQLLQNTIASERTLARAGEVAASYNMRSFSDVPKLGAQNAAARSVATPVARAVPQTRFITVPRPATRAPALVAPVPPMTPLDRLWNRLVGIGSARATGR